LGQKKKENKNKKKTLLHFAAETIRQQSMLQDGLSSKKNFKEELLSRGCDT